MHHMKEMIATHPDVKGSTNDALIRCLEECYSCAQTCTSCADACLAEEMVADDAAKDARDARREAFTRGLIAQFHVDVDSDVQKLLPK